MERLANALSLVQANGTTYPVTVLGESQLCLTGPDGLPLYVYEARALFDPAQP